MPVSAPTPDGVLCRSLRSQTAGDLRVLDALRDRDGGTARVFFATETPLAAVLPAEDGGDPTVRERREVSGGVMVVLDAPSGDTLEMATATGTIRVEADPDDRAFLADRNCALSFRTVETAETVIDWIGYHALNHGMTGAVIVNRSSKGHAAFAEAVRAALSDLAPDFRLVIVTAPMPLGKPGLGPESHPFLAPDAPGKDRMEPPAADPWLAPLGQGLIYEVLKWRFLAEARAVLTLDVSDILAPREGLPGAFDLCRASGSGVVFLVGHRAYPWRVRAGRPEHFGDHICRQFDARRGIARWGVAPDVAGTDNTWRSIRVAYARPEPGTIVHFWRCMGLRVPGRKPSELAPKTSLIEDDGLIDISTRLFRHKPVRAPVSETRAPALPQHAARRTCIVTTMKNEGPFILEWLAYHRAIGVDDFLIYTNDCSDGTDTMLAMLERKGLVQHRENPFRASGLKPQHAALQAAESEPIIQNCDWAICMDVDEFINIRIGDGTLGALYDAMGDANMIALTWRLFGNADVHEYQDRFLLEQFPLCAPELVRKPHQAWGFKTLFRNIDIYKKLGVHRPKGLRPDLWDQVRWLNGSGRPMPREMFRNGWRSTTDTYGYDWVSLNHYAVRSAESFLVKRDRGRVNHVDRDQGLNYWFRMNHNATQDRTIQRMIPLLQAERDRLMADPEIREAHDHSVAAHRAKIAELRAQPNYQRFYDELTGPRMERLSRLLHVFGSSVFNAGPGVIPADLHTRDLPPDFFFTVDFQGDAEH